MIIDDLDKIPTYKHFVIVTEKVVCQDDGYGGSYLTHELQYDCYTSQAEWEDMIRRYAASGKKFRAFQASPAQVATSTSVTIVV